MLLHIFGVERLLPVFELAAFAVLLITKLWSRSGFDFSTLSFTLAFNRCEGRSIVVLADNRIVNTCITTERQLVVVQPILALVNFS